MAIYRLFLRASPYKKVVVAAGFVAGFVAMASLFVGMGVVSIRAALSHHMEHQINSLDEATSRWLSTLHQLAALDESDACSDSFLQNLRLIAFLPDGIHELLYARKNAVICSVTLNRTDIPVEIGKPDFRLRGSGMDVWDGRDMAFVGQPGLRGTLLRSGNFLVVIAPPAPLPAPESWISTELVFNSDDAAGSVDRDRHDMGFTRSSCDVNQMMCVTMQASVGGFMSERKPRILIGFAIAIAAGFGATRVLREWLDAFWGLPMRIRHLMDTSSVTSVYQPILTLASDRIDAIEVLARWQDTTGDVIPPNEFLPIVEAQGLTRIFTERLVERVHRELLTLPKRRTPLRVHFNIFPADFDADWLLKVFSPLLQMPDRFVIVVELLESDQTPLEETRHTIEVLRENGILTYIDDFGAGYSNIEYLGHLPVAGVKLDRCFGQAPDGTLMAELLDSAAGMIDSAGYPLLVEGIETGEKLESLRTSGLAEQAQGYYISRPLSLPSLAAFLRKHRPQPALSLPVRLTAS